MGDGFIFCLIGISIADRFPLGDTATGAFLGKADQNLSGGFKRDLFLLSNQKMNSKLQKRKKEKDQESRDRRRWTDGKSSRSTGRCWEFQNLIVTDKALYYHRVGPGMGVYYGGGASNDDNPALMMTPIDEKAEQKVFADKVNSFVTSLNNKYAVLRMGSNHYVVELGTSPVSDLSKNQLDLSGWKFSVDPKEDWKQIYTDAWRMERDYFYDRNMHGLDWDAMYEKYLPLVERVTTRRELSDVMGELIGELSVLHTSVGGGDLRRGENQIQFGMLGGRFSKNEKLRGYTIDHIFLSDPDYPDEMSPLAHPDLNISKGEVITHIDGVSRWMLLICTFIKGQSKQAGQNQNPKQWRDRQRHLIIKPMSSGQESNLRYNEWEYTRRLAVEEKSQGELGDVHLRAMTASDRTMVP